MGGIGDVRNRGAVISRGRSTGCVSIVMLMMASVGGSRSNMVAMAGMTGYSAHDAIRGFRTTPVSRRADALFGRPPVIIALPTNGDIHCEVSARLRVQIDARVVRRDPDHIL